MGREKAKADAEYYKAHKDRLKQYRVDNKEKINERQNTKITCECGKTVSQTNLSQHRKTKYHTNYLKDNVPQKIDGSD